jgi:hypothetical protein
MTNMKSFVKAFLVIAAVALSAVSAKAQQGGQGGNQQVVPSQSSWKDSLDMARAEERTLTAILRSINSIDTARQNELIQWIITDRTIRSRVISALRKGGFRISPNSVAELSVTQKPPTPDNSDMALLRIVIEQVGVYGEPEIRRVLGTALYDQINQRTGYEYTLISTEPTQQKVQFVAMDASLFGGSIIFKSGFGFALNLGDDYIGYPFWLPGTIGTYGLIRRGTTDFKVGIEWPLGQSGVDPFTISQGLKIRERKLAGAMAFAAEVKQDLGLLSEQSGKLHFGLEFRNAFTPSINNFPAYAGETRFVTGLGGHGAKSAQDSIFYLALSAHGYLSYRMPDQILKGAYIQVGGGTHSIQPVTVGVPPYHQTVDGNVVRNQDLTLADRLNYFDPFVKIGYVRSSETGDEYGVSVQYSNLLLTDAWVKLFPWLEIEAKYATVIGRDPYKWEWKDYVMVSPKLTLNF